MDCLALHGAQVTGGPLGIENPMSGTPVGLGQAPQILKDDLPIMCHSCCACSSTETCRSSSRPWRLRTYGHAVARHTRLPGIG